MFVETSGLFVDGIDHDQPPAGRVDCFHSSTQGVHEQLGSEALAV
jgi:hypothetical protein